MPKSKRVNITWYCDECKKGNYHGTVNKKNQEFIKETKKFCGDCRKRVKHVRKETKS